MNRRLNVRLFLCLMAALVVLVGPGVYYLHAYQVKRTANFLLLQAKKQQDEGQLPKAVSYLSRYLALFPKDASVSADLAVLLANDQIAKTPQALQRAFWALDKALRLNGNRQDLRRRAVEMAMNPMLHLYADAAGDIEALIRLNHEDAQLFRWQGQCFEAAGKFEEAWGSYATAVSQPNKSEEDFMRLANLLRQKPDQMKKAGKTKEQLWRIADETIEQMLASLPQSPRAFLFGAGYHRLYPSQISLPVLRASAVSSLGPLPNIGPWLAIFSVIPSASDLAQERVAQEIARALALAPDDPEVLIAAADFDLQRQKISLARELLERGFKLYPEDWRMYQSLSRVEIEDKNPAAAVKVLQQGLDKLPKHLDLLWNLAQLHLRQGQNDEAAVLITRLESAGFPPSCVDYLRGRLLVNKEEWGKAVRLLEQTYPQLLARSNQTKNWFSFDVSQECLTLEADCCEHLGDPDRAATLYGQMLARDPLSLPARLGLARMELVLGHEDGALLHYRQIIQKPAPLAAWVECVQLLTARIVKDPRWKDAQWKTAKSTWAEIDQMLKRLEQLHPVPTAVTLLRAQVLATRAEFDSAREVLDNVPHEDKESPVEMWIARADLEQRRGNAAAALAILNEAQGRLGNGVQLRTALVRSWAFQSGAEAAVELDKLGGGVEKWPKVDQRRLLKELARGYERLGDTKKAADAWRKTAENSSDIASRMALFDLALGAGDDQEMSRVRDELKTIENEQGVLWRFCEACRLIAQGQKQSDKTLQKDELSKALALLTVVEGRRVGWNRVPEAKANIEDLQGRPDAAIENYKKAIVLGNRSPAVIRRVAQIYASRGQFLDAGEMLEKLREQTGSFGDLGRVAAEVALAQHDIGRALDIAQKAVATDSKDYRDHIWLGHVLWAADKLPEAQAQLRMAADLKPDSAEPVVALVQYFMRISDVSKAKGTLEEAEKNKIIPRDQALLPFALCHELIGQKDKTEIDKARKLYDEAQEVLEGKPGEAALWQAKAMFHLRQNERPQAQRELEKLLSLQATSPREAAQARRVLAVLMAFNRDYPHTKEALESLGVFEDVPRATTTDAAEVNLADERAKVVILAQQQNPRQRRQAIGILEKIAGLKRITEGEQFVLAQLYASVGEKSKVREQMALLVRAAQENVEKAGKGKEAAKTTLGNYLAYYAAILLREKAIAEAQNYVAELERLEPNSFRTVSIKARLLAGQDKKDEAGRNLAELAEKKPAEWLRPVAGELEAMGLDKDAEKMLRRFVAESEAKSPENALVLAGFLGRHNRPDEALSVCEQSWKDCKPEAVGGASVLVLYKAKCGPEHWQKVAGWLESACGKNPKSTVLLGYLSAVKRLQKNYVGVKSICRKILELKKDDALTMNNLAWILALKDHDTEQASKLIQNAIEVEGPKAGFLGTRAVIFMELGKVDQAVNDMQQVVEEAPTAINYFHLARAYGLANNRSAFLSAAHKAVDLKLDENAVDPLEHDKYINFLNQLAQLDGQ